MSSSFYSAHAVTLAGALDRAVQSLVEVDLTLVSSAGSGKGNASACVGTT